MRRTSWLRAWAALAAVPLLAAGGITGWRLWQHRLAPGSREARAWQHAYARQHRLDIEWENSIGMRFRLVPPGEFVMGSPPTERDRDSNEGPQRRVRIDYPLYVGVCEVTQGQWQAVMGKTSLWVDGDVWEPAKWLDWENCQGFIEQLAEREGAPPGTYRLLSEAEWEYACRAGTSTRFCTGNTDADLRRAGWACARSTTGHHFVDRVLVWMVCRAGRENTIRVARRAPNAWGLHDMHGNVWEWVEDDWHESYDGAPADGSAWTDSPRGPTQVVRGGSWFDIPGACRSANRYRRYEPPHPEIDVGFRLAREILPASAP